MLHPELNNHEFNIQGKAYLLASALVFVVSNLHDISAVLGLIGSILGILGGCVVLGLNIDRWVQFRKKIKNNEKDENL